MNKISVYVDWRGTRDMERAIAEVKAADESGVYSIGGGGENWGRDAFTWLSLVAEHTKNVQISSVVNTWSRSPAALAQHFATLDELSGGRMVIGLGASGANVIEDFHGIPFEKPLRRVREYVEIINMLIAQEPLHYDGEIYHLHRGFRLSFETVRKHIPIHIAALTPVSVRQTARIADGWLPTITPFDKLGEVIKDFRDTAAKAGRNPEALTVAAPNRIHITKDIARGRRAVASTFAYHMARMGRFYHEHVTRLGYGEYSDATRTAWEQGGGQAAADVVPEHVIDQFGLVTDSIEAAREQIARQEAVGINLHAVTVDAETPQERAKVYEQLSR
ncbi:MAG: LLM class flavin-dependent oxidoreductase [Dehalococcoidia bacterium]